MKKILVVGLLVMEAVLLIPHTYAQSEPAPQIFSAQNNAPQPGILRVGQKVEVEYLPDSSKWLPAAIVEVMNDGYSYRVRVAPYGDGKTLETTIHFKRVRAAKTYPDKLVTDNKSKTIISNKLVFGKYGCTASKYSAGSVQYIMRGSFVITKDGRYTYYGFKKPSEGNFTVDNSGDLSFNGGYFHGGKAEKIDRPNKFFLVFPSNPDHRWTCGLIEKR